MPRPKMNLAARLHFAVTEEDREIIERLARDPETPTLTQVLRVAIRYLDRSRQRKSDRRTPVAS